MLTVLHKTHALGEGRFPKRRMMGKQKMHHVSKESRAKIFINLESWLQKNVCREPSHNHSWSSDTSPWERHRKDWTGVREKEGDSRERD